MEDELIRYQGGLLNRTDPCGLRIVLSILRHGPIDRASERARLLTGYCQGRYLGWEPL